MSLTCPLKICACVDNYNPVYCKTPNKRPPPINAPPYTLDPMLEFTLLAISQLKMVRFLIRKKLLKGENVLSKATMPANAHGRLLGVLRYVVNCPWFVWANIP